MILRRTTTTIRLFSDEGSLQDGYDLQGIPDAQVEHVLWETTDGPVGHQLARELEAQHSVQWATPALPVLNGLHEPELETLYEDVSGAAMDMHSNAADEWYAYQQEQALNRLGG